jgi:hypothetical protein
MTHSCESESQEDREGPQLTSSGGRPRSLLCGRSVSDSPPVGRRPFAASLTALAFALCAAPAAFGAS